MLVVKIELHSANTGHIKEIGRMYVCNEGVTHRRGRYGAYVCRRGSAALPAEVYGLEAPSKTPKAARVGEVKDYPRLSYNVWRLISRAIRAAFPEEG